MVLSTKRMLPPLVAQQELCFISLTKLHMEKPSLCSSAQPGLTVQVSSFINKSNLSVSMKAENQVRLLREQNRSPESSRVELPTGHPLFHHWWEERG